MQDFKLSFCIPTYKRPLFLLKAIESIITASAEYLDVVQIVITDDSTDDTNEWVIEKVKNLTKNLKYIQNPINLGIDGNILHSIDSSDGDFIWVLGEDDLVCTNAVKIFLALTNSNDYGFICSNYSYIDSEQKEIIKHNVIGISSNQEVSSLELLENHSWSFGFIGACIVNKTVWRTVNSSKYKGTFFAHVGTILESIKDSRILMLSTPLILNRMGVETTTWGAEYTFEVITGWANLMQKLKSIYPNDSCDRACQQFDNKLGANSLSFLFSKRSEGIYTKEAYNKFYKNSPRGVLYHLIALFILILDPDFCKEVSIFKRKIQKSLRKKSYQK
jgi:glycosyltransferase involved in cell wall biosynthesis